MSVYKILQKTSGQITEDQGYEIIKIDPPGKFLSKKEISYIASVISKAKSHIFTKDYTQRQDLYETILSSDIFVAIFFQKRLVSCGFAKKYQEADVTYLYSAFVRKTYQNKGIGKLLMKACIDTTLFSFITQTPLSYLLLQSITKQKKLYPNRETKTLPENFLKQLGPVIKNLPGKYNSQTNIVTLRDGYSSFPAMPLSTNTKLNNWIYENLYKNRKQGEEHLFFCVGAI